MIHQIKRCAVLLTGLGLLCSTPCATAGSLAVNGNLSGSNLTASAINLNGQTISNWPGNLSGGVTVLSSPVLDFSQTGYFYSFTLTNNATTWSFTNHVAGKILWLQITQDATGGWSNTFPNTLLGPGGNPVVDTALNPASFSVFQILDTGNSWVTLAARQNYQPPCSSNCQYALQFDGAQNYATVPSANFGTTTMMWEFWFNTTATFTGMNRYPLYGYNGTGTGFYLADSVYNMVWVIGDTVYTYGGTTGLNDGNWHHVAGTYDGTNANLYIDESLDGTASGTTTLSAMPVEIGYNVGHWGNQNPWQGMIDEVRISNVVRSPADDPCSNLVLTADGNTIALWHLDDGPSHTTAVDASGNGHDASLQGSPPPAWVAGATCSDDDMDMLSGRGGGRFSFGTGGSSGTTTSAPTSGSSMTITDTLGRIWELIH